MCTGSSERRMQRRVVTPPEGSFCEEAGEGYCTRRERTHADALWQETLAVLDSPNTAGARVHLPAAGSRRCPTEPPGSLS